MVDSMRRDEEKKLIQMTEAVEPENAGTRVDIFLTGELGFSRANVQKLINDGTIFFKDKQLKANYKVKVGDVFGIIPQEAVPIDAQPENIPLDIIYEDADVVVINKARGMVVHPATGNYTGTLVNALLYHCTNLSGINGVIRPGIVHRLDKDTSGIMIVAKNDTAHISLSEQIHTKKAKRTYLTVVRGNIKKDTGTIETLISRDTKDRKRMAVVAVNGRRAITDYRVLERYGKFTIVRCKLLTGRTHQIRVHMEYIGHPIVGDPKYSPMKTCFGIKGQALHSESLVFTHPRTGEVMEFHASLPDDMNKILTRLRNGQFN
ncbi:MAG: RluA family pseudouridine synthase [Acidaminococcaceae bacterium]